MRAGCLVVLLLVLAVPARADDAATDAIYKTYLAARTEQGFRGTEKRLATLRRLCGVDGERARGLLVKIARGARDHDDKLLAVAALGARADAATNRELGKQLAKKPEPELLRAWANGLARNPNDAIVEWLVGEALASPKPEFLQACAHALAGHPDHGGAAVLVALYAKHSGNRRGVDIAHEAVRALGAAGGDEATETLLVAAEHKDWRIRLAAADVLPLRDSTSGEILAALRGLLADPYAAVRQASARAVGDAKLEVLVPELIALLEEAPRLRTRHGAYVALKAISGLDFSFDAAAWRQWFESKEAGLDARRMSFASYYGFSVHSDRVLFVVDLSGSMRWDGGYSVSRLDVARTELTAVLTELPKGCLFNILVYSSKVREWQKKEVPATPANVARATRWILGTFQEPDGDTHTHPALEAAFKRNPEFDTLYFLSDGVPSHGEYVSHEGILASVEVWNRYRRAVIHTFALTFTGKRPDLVRKYQGERTFMSRLAKGAGGEVRVIRRPPR